MMAYKKVVSQTQKIIKRHSSKKNLKIKCFHDNYYKYNKRIQLPDGICIDPEARLDAAVIALKTEYVQFHIPLLPKAD